MAYCNIAELCPFLAPTLNQPKNQLLSVKAMHGRPCKASYGTKDGDNGARAAPRVCRRVGRADGLMNSPLFGGGGGGGGRGIVSHPHFSTGSTNGGQIPSSVQGHRTRPSYPHSTICRSECVDFFTCQDFTQMLATSLPKVDPNRPLGPVRWRKSPW